MDELSRLLRPELYGLTILLAPVMQMIYNIFDPEDGTVSRLAFGIYIIVVLALGQGIGWLYFNGPFPQPATSFYDIWVIQGLLCSVALFLGNRILKAVYGSEAKPRTKRWARIGSPPEYKMEAK